MHLLVGCIFAKLKHTIRIVALSITSLSRYRILPIHMILISTPETTTPQQDDNDNDSVVAESPSLSTNNNNSSRMLHKTRLPDDFVPNRYSVLCGRGKECFNYIGNRRFRVMVDMNLERYSLAETKSDKTRIVCEIVQTIRQSSGGGGYFCKQEHEKWYDVGDAVAREKVGAHFRDCLHAMYKSSSKAKTAVRRQRREMYREIESSSSIEEGSSSVSLSDDLMDSSSSSSSLDGSQGQRGRGGAGGESSNNYVLDAGIREVQMTLDNLDLDNLLLTDDDFDFDGDTLFDFAKV